MEKYREIQRLPGNFDAPLSGTRPFHVEGGWGLFVPELLRILTQFCDDFLEKNFNHIFEYFTEMKAKTNFFRKGKISKTIGLLTNKRENSKYSRNVCFQKNSATIKKNPSTSMF